MPREELYKTQFVRSLFNEMAKTYGIVNMISSLGFTCRWRRQCLDAIQIPQGSIVLDLMSGMGETCHDLAGKIGKEGNITTIDISHAMCKYSLERHYSTVNGVPVNILEADALDCPLADNSFDVVVSVFGLKTFNEQQTTRLASEVCRMLKPGGTFSFLEISIPPSTLLRLPYALYLRFMIPILGYLLMGNPDNYRLLYVYTRAFGNCRKACTAFNAAGLVTQYRTYFFGCASVICGFKPA